MSYQQLYMFRVKRHNSLLPRVIKLEKGKQAQKQNILSGLPSVQDLHPLLTVTYFLNDEKEDYKRITPSCFIM